jgi:type II secretory pathway component GspD/PulD (secretin)
VGEDVPVLGAVTYTGATGAPVQSVEYRSSGVIFDLYPVLHADTVDLTVMQQVSNFNVTQTGVNNSPTLSKRELKTSLTVSDGELIVIGGLADTKETDTHSGLSFLPAFMHTKSKSKSNTEILLILQLQRV